jgi:hypothetical protein
MISHYRISEGKKKYDTYVTLLFVFLIPYDQSLETRNLIWNVAQILLFFYWWLFILNNGVKNSLSKKLGKRWKFIKLKLIIWKVLRWLSVLRVIMLRLLYSQSHQSVFFHDLSPVFNQTCATDFNRGPGLPEFTTGFFGGVRVSQYIEFCALLCQPLLILSSFYFGY